MNSFDMTHYVFRFVIHWITAALLLLKYTMSDCPDLCVCESLQEMFSITCEGMKDADIILLTDYQTTAQQLNLERNFIQTITATSFAFPGLTTLNLNRNHINALNKDSFSKAVRLKTLLLQNNYIRNVSNEAFLNLHHVEVLDLANNNMQYICRQFYLEDLANLQILRLSGNKIQQLCCGAFQYLVHLKQLFLSKNHIIQICPTLFQYLHALEELFLDVNSLTELPHSVFHNLSKLGIVSLGGNLLTDLPHSLFSPSLKENSLKMLSLEHNKLHHVPSATLANLQNLTLLDISQNAIFELSQNTFIQLTSLKRIHVSYMPNLKVVHNYSFYSLVALETVVMHSNPELTTIGSAAFHDVPNLISVDLHGNNLSMLNIKTLNWSSLETLDLSSNPWDCTCELKYLKYILMSLSNVTGHKANSANSSISWINRVTCRTPKPLKDFLLVNLKVEDLICKEQPETDNSPSGVVKQHVMVAIIVTFAGILLICIVILAVRNRQESRQEKEKKHVMLRRRRLRRRLDYLNREYSATSSICSSVYNLDNLKDNRLVRAAENERMIPSEHMLHPEVDRNSLCYDERVYGAVEDNNFVEDYNVVPESPPASPPAGPGGASGPEVLKLKRVCFDSKVVVRVCKPLIDEEE